jgi:C-terminal processing protease CtpA/Prc
MGDALRKADRRGEYRQISNGDQLARLLTTQLQAVSRDKHLRVIFDPVVMPVSPAGPGPRMTSDGCGFEKAERLPGNVGYVKLNQFGDPDACRDVAAAAMAFIANADAVIFDLRDNGGGHPHMVAFLCSYLFAERTHLNDFWMRANNETRESWTSEQVPGAKFTTQPIYVLTSRRTFSGAEEFSYNLKHLKRATIVGEVTGGGAHPVRIQRIDDRFSVAVPDARPINAVTKTNWEGTGVEPDVMVAAAEALTTAQRLAASMIAAGRAGAEATP